MVLGLIGDAGALSDRAGCARAAAQRHAVVPFRPAKVSLAGVNVITVGKGIDRARGQTGPPGARVAGPVLARGVRRLLREEHCAAKRNKEPAFVMDEKADRRGPEPPAAHRPGIKRLVGWTAKWEKRVSPQFGGKGG